MELPATTLRQKYVESVKALELALKDATNNENSSSRDLRALQQQLDVVAADYQHNEEIGSARYKLYELQAFIHYFEHNDDKALGFINQAIAQRGATYQKAEKLRELLTSKSTDSANQHTNEPALTKAEKRKKLIGLEGWLALFIVGQFIALAMTIYNLFADGLAASDVDLLNEYQAGLGSNLQTLITLESICLVIFTSLVVTTLVLLFRKRKLAKAFAITSLAFGAVYGIVDYAVASSLFESSGLDQGAEMQSLMSDYAGDVGRSVFSALVWIPYFLRSRRVKITLTKS